MNFTDHAKERMAEYGISEREVLESLENPDNLFLDVLTGEITIVTVFPTSKINKIEDRIRSGRWLEI